MSEITVRSAIPADAPALGRLGAMLLSLHHDFDSDRFIAPTPDTARSYGEFLGSELGQSAVILLVAEGDGVVLGYTYSRMEGTDFMALRGPAGVVYDLLVDPTHRGGGIGRKLLDATLAAIAARGAPRVVLSTAYRNEAAQRLFAAAGFRPTMIEMTRELGD